MDLLDVNILLYAFNQNAARHEEYKEFLRSLAAGPAPFAVPDVVFSGFLRIATNPKLMEPPSTLDDAIIFATQVHSLSHCRVATSNRKQWNVFLDICRRGKAHGSLISDAYLAAMAIERDDELVTADRGFGRWPGLKWRHPLDG
jgi:uncharacterized protein